MPRTHYVIAAYFGPRRVGGPKYEHDPSYFLNLQFERLARLRHGFARVTVVVNGERPSQSWPNEIDDTPIVWIERANLGGSYAAWDDVLRASAAEFDYHVLTEDDYVLARDDVDSVLVDLMREHGYGAMFSQFAGHAHDARLVHPSIAMGIFDGAMVREVMARWGSFLVQKFNDAGYHEWQLHQVRWHHRVLDCGRTVGSMIDHGIGIKFWEGFVRPLGEVSAAVLEPAQDVTS